MVYITGLIRLTIPVKRPEQVSVKTLDGEKVELATPVQVTDEGEVWFGVEKTGAYVVTLKDEEMTVRKTVAVNRTNDDPMNMIRTLVKTTVDERISTDLGNITLVTGPPGAPGQAGSEGTEGPAGPDGPAGPEGPAGPQGPRGFQGIQGEQGVPGIRGLEGPEGPRGPAGETGLIGPQGTTGERGRDGEPGSSGPQGLRGVQGEAGPQGVQGVKGDPGTNVQIRRKVETVPAVLVVLGTATVDVPVVWPSPMPSTDYAVIPNVVVSTAALAGKTTAEMKIGTRTATGVTITVTTTAVLGAGTAVLDVLAYHQ